MNIQDFLLRSLAALMLIVFLMRCSQKTTPPPSQPKPDELELPSTKLAPPILRDFKFLSDTLIAREAVDSLYVFHKEIKLHPDIITFQPYGELLWNDSAQLFITRGNFNLISKELKLLFEDKKNRADRIFSFTKLPYAIGTNDVTLNFYDLNTRKLIKKFPVEGTVLRFHELPNERLAVLTNTGKNKLLHYFFDAAEWTKTDTLYYPEEIKGRPFAVDPSQQYLITGSALELNVISLKDQKLIKKIDLFPSSYDRPYFNKNGDRLILTSQGGFSKASRIKIFSFPNLEEISEHFMKYQPNTAMKDNLLLAGDREGNVNLIDLQSGQIIYTRKERNRIFSLAILNQREILLGTSSKEKLTLSMIDIESNNILRSLKTSTDYIVPMAISDDSKKFYFYEGNTLSSLNLTNLTVEPIKTLPYMAQASINANSTLMSFRGNRWSTNILNLSNGSLETNERTEANFFFAGNTDELLFFYRDSTKTLKINSNVWSQKWDRTIVPRTGSVTQPQIFTNPLNDEEIIFPGELDGRNMLIYLNKFSYEVMNTRPLRIPNKKGKFELIGIDKNGDFYLADRYYKLYSFDAHSFELKDSIPGTFYSFNSRLASSDSRDALYTKQDNRAFLLSPHSSNINQEVDPWDFYWFSPDLEYFIQTTNDVIRVHKWNKGLVKPE